MPRPKPEEEFTIINVRLTNTLLHRLDEAVDTMKARSPGVSFSRSDIIRMAVEELTKNLLEESQPRKKAAGRR